MEHYLYEQDSYVPLARMDQTKGTTEPQLYYFHCNASGQPEELTDADGNILWHARYAAWGKLVFESTTSHAPFGFEQNLRMQGQYDDRITGLYYNTFRYYDPDIGRFTTEDPIGLLGGTNLYQYAPNPLSWIDPWGWFCGSQQGHHPIPQFLGGNKKQNLITLNLLSTPLQPGFIHFGKCIQKSLARQTISFCVIVAFVTHKED